jgi:UDP-N-acetylglucosamine 2-epimerase
MKKKFSSARTPVRCAETPPKHLLTDSGGIQEETTALGVPCVTLRLPTERPSTVELGMNRLVGVNKSDIICAAHEGRNNKMPAVLPDLWDGHAASRILDAKEQWFADSAGVGFSARNSSSQQACSLVP